MCTNKADNEMNRKTENWFIPLKPIKPKQTEKRNKTSVVYCIWGGMLFYKRKNTILTGRVLWARRLPDDIYADDAGCFNSLL